MHQNTQIVNALIEKGASAAVCDSSGATPVHLAAAMGNFTICRNLVQNGEPNLLSRDNEGNYALDLANAPEMRDFLQRAQNQQDTEHRARVRALRKAHKNAAAAGLQAVAARFTHCGLAVNRY